MYKGICLFDSNQYRVDDENDVENLKIIVRKQNAEIHLLRRLLFDLLPISTFSLCFSLEKEVPKSFKLPFVVPFLPAVVSLSVGSSSSLPPPPTFPIVEIGGASVDSSQSFDVISDSVTTQLPLVTSTGVVTSSRDDSPTTLSLVAAPSPANAITCVSSGSQLMTEGGGVVEIPSTTPITTTATSIGSSSHPSDDSSRKKRKRGSSSSTNILGLPDSISDDGGRRVKRGAAATTATAATDHADTAITTVPVQPPPSHVAAGLNAPSPPKTVKRLADVICREFTSLDLTNSSQLVVAADLLRDELFPRDLSGATLLKYGVLKQLVEIWTSHHATNEVLIYFFVSLLLLFLILFTFCRI
jgi:hypothetical protein